MIQGTLRGIESVIVSDSTFAARVDSLAGSTPFEWVAVMRALRSQRPDRAEELARRTLSRALPGPMLQTALGSFTSVLVANGDYQTADSLWSSRALDPPDGPPTRFLVRLVHGALTGLGDSVLTMRALSALEAWIPIDSALAHFDKRPVWSTSFTLGAWHATFGDTAVARRWRETIANFRAGGNPRTWRESIIADIGSRLAERRGQPDSALTLARQAFTLWTVHTENAGDNDVEPAMRYRYGRLLLAAGQRDSAQRIMRSFVPPTGWLGLYVPLAYATLGEIAEADGRPAEAAAHYASALRYWTLGDSTVAARRASVTAAIQRTRGN